MSHEKVLWEEGMFLGPQHFQAWERHVLGQVHGRLQVVLPHGYGLTALRIDEEALAQGEFLLEQVAGVFRDGTCFRSPEVDTLPMRRRFADAFHPRANALGVHLAVREPRSGAMLSRADDASVVGRYRRRKLEVTDEFSGSAVRDVAVGDLDLRLLWEGEALDGCQAIEIARVVRTGSSYQLDRKFVPACLHTGVSPELQKLLRRTADLLSAKSEELAQKRGQRVGGTAQFTAVDVSNFSLRQAVNSYLPSIAHFCRTPHVHPETVYGVLASFVGVLCTYSPDKLPTEVPPYDHANLTTTFAELDRHLRELPGQIAPDTCVSIPLQRRGTDEWIGQVTDDSLFERADFYLSLSGTAPADKFIREAPFKVKLTSPAQMEAIRSFNLRGVVLSHMPDPPPDIPRRTGCQYFALQREGKHWDAIRDVRTLAVFVPGEFEDVQIECLAVMKVNP
jgi:type VI secretion system protein ImpJ